MIRYLVVIFLLNVSTINAQTIDKVTPTLFSYYTENYPPSNYVINDELVGASVETLKLMWENMGVAEQPITIATWARGYRNTLNKPLTMLFSMSKTKEREKLFKWVGPIFTDTHVLIASADFSDEINTMKESFNYQVAAVRDDISDIKLRETGFPAENIVKVTKLDQALQMVRSKRADLMILTSESLAKLVKRNNFSLEEFKEVWIVSKNRNFYAFNKSTPDSIIAQFQQAFNNIEAQRLAILEKYHLKP